MEYKIAVGYKDPKNVEKVVKALIEDGWAPNGGLGVCRTQQGLRFYQPMVRHDLLTPEALAMVQKEEVSEGDAESVPVPVGAVPDEEVPF